MAGPTTVTRAGREGRASWRRRLAWLAGGSAALLLGAVATLDWWLPAAAGHWAGAGFSARDTRFGEAVAWRDLTWSRDGLAFAATSVRLDAPSVILWRKGKAEAEIEGWTLTIETDGAPVPGPSTDGKFGWPELMDTLSLIGRELERRAGEVTLTKGLVRVAGEEIELSLLEAKGCVVRGTAKWRGEAVNFQTNLTELRVRARWPRGDLRASLIAEGRTGVKGEMAWAGNLARVTAEFAPRGWIPTEFEVAGSDWSVPAARLGLGEAYADPRGGFVLRRVGDGVRVTADAVAAPRAKELPEVKLALGGELSPAGVRLDRFSIDAPQLRAKLSAPLEWKRGAGWDSAGSPEFAWNADLSALTGGRVTGRAEGSARWSGGADWRIAWEARGEGLGWAPVQGVSAKLRGESTAVATRVLTAELRGADGVHVEGGGRYLHLERRVEDAVIKAELPGAALTRWLPAGLTLGQIELEVGVSGTMEAPVYEGRAEVADPALAGWTAERVSLAAKGTGWEAEKIVAAAIRGKARAEGRWAGDLRQGLRGELTLHRRDGRELVSTGFATSWTEGRLTVDLRLAGGAGEELQLTRNESGETALCLRNLDSDWPADWRAGPPLPELAARALTINGKVDPEGFPEGTGNFDLTWRARDGMAPFRARGEGAIGSGGLRLGRFELEQEAETLASGEGAIPWRIKVQGKRELHPVAGGQWALRLESRPEASFWSELAKLAGVELERPALELALSGPATAPSGRMALSADRIGLRGEGLPDGGVELRDLQMAAVASRGDLRIERLTGRVDGQRLEADARLLITDDEWDDLRASPYAWLRDHAEARLSLPGAQVAALARYVPTVLAPVGTLAAELRLTPGANLDGTLRLNDGATRPLGDFGVLQGIQVELLFSGSDVRIARLEATAGGQAVVITGGARRIPGRPPALDLTVKAKRFPLLRRIGLLLRGDLDLTVKTEGFAEKPKPGRAAGGMRTRVGGEVRLRDSLFLADIRPLISTGGGSAAAVRARPPYFSVETEPLADWELALRVAGDRFLRMRTPVFEGTGSARFDLTGTFREPRAIGEFRVDRGNILFPFATFAVQEGAVRLRANDPYAPMLDFRATGRRLGYDLRMELGGTADSPQLQLFSSPPLDAENLLLMVTAGAAPTPGLGAASASQRLAAVGAYVGRDLLRTLGLGGADEERLTFSAGEKVSRQGRETYGFEFRLDDRWSLAGDYDEFDAYNVGIKRQLRAPARDEPIPREFDPNKPDANNAKGTDDAR